MFTAGAFALAAASTSPLLVSSFVSNPAFHAERHYLANNNNDRNHAAATVLSAEPSSWSLSENWDSLSGESASMSASPATATATSSKEEINDPIGRAVRQLEQEEQQWIAEHEGAIPLRDAVDTAVDEIHSSRGDPSDPPLYDTAETLKQYMTSPDDKFVTSADQEISMLVRCNESPDALLAGEGRALTPLTQDERQDVAQLIEITFDAASGASQLNMTPFFVDAVAKMFFDHATVVQDDAKSKCSCSEKVMTKDGVAHWIMQSLGNQDTVSRHDKRVLRVVSKYSEYGSGVITGSGLLELYKDTALVGLDDDGNVKKFPAGKENPLENVWRDFEAHGVVSPKQQVWDDEMDQIRALHAKANAIKDNANSNADDMLLDECEILEWKKDSATPDWTIDSQGVGENQRKMSHEMVDLCKDRKTPKSMRDGQFIFIDEESCIGCNQCAHIAPSSFIMLDTGRARTFNQRNTRDVDTAVSACPVTCMKQISFQELTELETARDKGDGRSDHRHMGGNIAHTPLHVALRGTDANHKSSWYHYLKSKCLMSNSCPKKGCYDCPFYNEPGANPYFIKRQEAAQDARLAHVLKTGEGDKHRRFVEL